VQERESGRGAATRYHGPVSVNLARPVGSVLVAVATIVTIVAVAVLVFFNPIWVGFEQGRTGVEQLTGFTTEEVRTVTGQILAEMVVGPGTFEMTVQGHPVFDEKERAHLADVRTVFIGLAIMTLVSIAILAVASRARPPRRWLWIGVAAGSATLAMAVVVLGVVFGLFFDTAFEVFHRLLFGAGSYDFDPATERLVQLFPEQFWFETSLVLAIVLIVLSVIVIAISVPRIDPAEPVAAAAPPAKPQVAP
jgi:integral membrane protein (TIGR01906 family)